MPTVCRAYVKLNRTKGCRSSNCLGYNLVGEENSLSLVISTGTVETKFIIPPPLASLCEAEAIYYYERAKSLRKAWGN